MKKTLQITLAMFFTFVVISCDQSEELNPSQNQNENVSEISLLERETGITFFKQDIKLTDEGGKNTVTMRVAGKSESMVKAYLETYKFSISAIYESGDYRKNSNKTKPIPFDDGVREEQSTDGLFTEFISKQLVNGVIGFKTNAILKNRSLTNGRTAVASDFPNAVTHYNNSGNWPEIFKMYAYQTVGYKFMGKTNWASGWSTRTFCNYFNNTDCFSYWEHASEKWINVDGPRDVRATVYFNNYTDYSFQWVNE